MKSEWNEFNINMNLFAISSIPMDPSSQQDHQRSYIQNQYSKSPPLQG